MPFAVMVLSLVVGGMALLLVLNTASAANELNRHELATQNAGIAAQVQQLRNQVAASEAPANLAQAAQNLGMVPAANPAFLVISADGSVVARGSAAPVASNLAPVPPAKKKTTPKTAKATQAAKAKAAKAAQAAKAKAQAAKTKAKATAAPTKKDKATSGTPKSAAPPSKPKTSSTTKPKPKTSSTTKTKTKPKPKPTSGGGHR